MFEAYKARLQAGQQEEEYLENQKRKLHDEIEMAQDELYIIRQEIKKSKIELGQLKRELMN